MKMLILALLGISSLHVVASEINVQVENLRSELGTIHFILFKDEKGYPDDPSQSVTKGSFKASHPGVQIKDLEPGLYALTFIHDENDNGELDKKFGFPKEGFAFSKNPRIFFGPPSFSRSSFKLKQKKDLLIKMKYM